jgi:hypothetical protein
MPALPVITDTCRIALLWQASNGQIAVNVMHIRGVSAPPTYAQIEDALNAHVTANMWATVSTNASIVEVSMTLLDGVTATLSFNPTTPAHWTGGFGTDFIPQGSSLIKFQTLLRGRSHRGRMFLPYLPETLQTAGALDPAETTDAEVAWAAFQVALQGNSPALEHVVASYKLATAQPVAAYVAEGESATQRRRQTRNRP